MMITFTMLPFIRTRRFAFFLEYPGPLVKAQPASIPESKPSSSSPESRSGIQALGPAKGFTRTLIADFSLTTFAIPTPAA